MPVGRNCPVADTQPAWRRSWHPTRSGHRAVCRCMPCRQGPATRIATSEGRRTGSPLLSGVPTRLPTAARRCSRRSDVRSQGILARDIARIRRREHRGRVGEEAGPMDVGDHALIRGLGTASPLVRPGASRSYCGRRHGRPQSVRREFPCRCPAPTPAQPYGRRVDAARCATPSASASPRARSPRQSLPARGPQP